MVAYRNRGASLALVLASIVAFSTTSDPVSRPVATEFYIPFITTDSNPRHGLAWSYMSLDGDAWRDYNLSWYYNWAAKGSAAVPDTVEFVPMIWCDDDYLKEKAVAYIPANYDGYIMVANEPEFPDQCGRGVGAIADLIHWTRETWPDAKLVGPHTHVCWWEDNPPRPPCGSYGPRFTVESLIWEYRERYNTDPPLFAYGVHYGDVVYWSRRLGEFLRELNIAPVLWYSEWNYCSEDMGGLEVWIDHLQSSSYVHRYAYWSNMVIGNHCSLADIETGNILPRGLIYSNAGR